MNSDETFQEFAKKLLGQLWKDLDHRFVSGVQVLIRLAHDRQDHRGAIAPVVFTSALSYRSREFYPCFLAGQGEIVYSISQTPQVWLDHVVSVDETGRLIFSWFVVEDLFPPGMVADMFQAYVSHLRRLAVDEAAWAEPRHERAKKLIPERQLQQRKTVNATAQPISRELLHLLFEKRAKQNPEQTAVVYRDVRLSYSQLVQLSRRLGRQLRDLGAKPNSLVAIVMEKGWEQVVAALAILQSGAAYVPIDSNLPRERLFRLLENAQVDVALTQPWLDKSLDWPTAIRRVCVEEAGLERNGFEALEPIQKPEDLAYVIYTSGSTGLPKGVMIDHRGAVNTILDMNQRFRVGPEDRVLAMSSLSFDLSVYDLFGVLAAGGTIVIPESSATRDPAHWADLMRQERVTLWNSVPALMEMLVEYVEGRAEVLPPSLRLVLLSGDWIPVTLPDKIKVLANDIQLMSLGGATEASIWSILYPIERVDPSWKSIPYGRPMVNQSFHVLNEVLEPCPVWAAGQLYIGGVGLAKGYWRDEEKTREKFITHPRTGERFYCTGDLGRYLP
ncbi:MAG: amino acid adenylation domain-containing protein, partial [Terriglobia bacterium]